MLICAAIDMGVLAVANAEHFLEGRALVPFKPAPKPVLIAFGDLQTYLVAGTKRPATGHSCRRWRRTAC